ncbi:MAG: pyridoxamine 5'-phosphate oxidase family protein [Actinobacteria bacterium]|nr:pyridoxamine 5'-phosphate oxidase family protein [Actinomycetota bacterium]
MPSHPGVDHRSRVTVRRHPERGSHDRAIIHRILDEALFCHVGFVVGAQPFVIPTIHARSHDRLYVHGSSASRMLRALGARIPVCVTVTILDGLVLARSVFDHSMNYRSVVVLGTAHPVEGADEKTDALRAIVEHVMPGRWAQARHPTAKELKATSVLSLSLEEASAKIRVGPPKDDPGDLTLPVWAGEVPVRLQYLAPRPDPALPPGIDLPANVARAGRGTGS